MLHTTTTKGNAGNVVLVHGNSLSSEVWSRQLGSSALDRYRICAIDLPGHGASPRFPADRPYTLDAMAREVAYAISCLEAPILVGHSLGGHVAMRVLGHAPQVRGLVLLGAPPLSSVADMAQAFLPSPDIAKAFQADLTHEDMVALAQFYTWSNSPYIERIVGLIRSTDPRVRSSIGEEIASGRWTDEQALIRSSGIPVCMLHGEVDPGVSLPYLQELAPNFWRGRVDVIQGAGHSPQLQTPEAFDARLLEFIERERP